MRLFAVPLSTVTTGQICPTKKALATGEAAVVAFYPSHDRSSSIKHSKHFTLASAIIQHSILTAVSNKPAFFGVSHFTFRGPCAINHSCQHTAVRGKLAGAAES